MSSTLLYQCSTRNRSKMIQCHWLILKYILVGEFGATIARFKCGLVGYRSYNQRLSWHDSMHVAQSNRRDHSLLTSCVDSHGLERRTNFKSATHVRDALYEARHSTCETALMVMCVANQHLIFQWHEKSEQQIACSWDELWFCFRIHY